jgi:hypothetical protein
MSFDSLIGTAIDGRYQVIRLLGEGAMGRVYLAEHVTLGRKVAVKVLRRSSANDPEMIERFRREARAVSRLEHPGIVYISDFGQTDDQRFYLAMEHVDGPTLGELEAAALPGVLPLDRALDVLRQITDALAAAHDAGIIHRDLKPENIKVPSRCRGRFLAPGARAPWSSLIDALLPGPELRRGPSPWAGIGAGRSVRSPGPAGSWTTPRLAGVPASPSASVWAGARRAELPFGDGLSLVAMK